jgi:hypothetical protein
MSFDASSFSGSESARRKTYAIVGVGVCVLLFVVVYAFSGSKPAPKKVVEPDRPLPSIDGQTVVDLDKIGGDSGWYDNVPSGTIVAQNPQAGTDVKDAPTTPLSPVIIGDNPATEPPADSVMKPGQAPGTGVVAQNETSGVAAQVSGSAAQGNSAVDSTAVAGERLKPGPTPAVQNGAMAVIQPITANATIQPITANATTQPSTANPPPGQVAAPVATPPPVNAPLATIPPVNAPVATIPPVNAPVATIPPVNAPVTKNPPVNAPVAKIGAPAASPVPSSFAKKGKSTASAQRPKFVRPTRKQPGIIARTSELVTEPEFRQAPKPAAAQAKPGQTSAKPVTVTKPAPPARVRQQEARTFAAQTTEQLREQGLIKPGQRIRLPRSTETPNPTIWREDDAPVTPEERRPFGLVLAEENPASTPEGIPLRTDIPAGASPLEKTGADKPLWKRPE